MIIQSDGFGFLFGLADAAQSNPLLVIAVGLASGATLLAIIRRLTR